MLDQFSVVKRRVLQKATFILLFLLLEAIVWGKIALIEGFLLGGVGSFLNFWHLNRTYEKLLNNEVGKNQVAHFVYSKYVFRLAFSLLLLGFSLKLGKEVFIGAIMGFLIIKAAIFLENMLELLQNYFNNYLAKIRRR